MHIEFTIWIENVEIITLEVTKNRVTFRQFKRLSWNFIYYWVISLNANEPITIYILDIMVVKVKNWNVCCCGGKQ